jgi:hypothetical protein
MITTPYLTDILKELVETAGKWTREYYGHDVYFKHGTIDEIALELKAMKEDPNQRGLRYPLIALFHDFDRKFGGEGVAFEATVNMAIMMITDSGYSSETRLITNFKPILQPIQDAFIYSLLASGYFFEVTEAQLKFSAPYIMRWGKERLPDYDFVDAILIKNLTLTLKKETQ